MSNRANQGAVLWIHGGGYLIGSAEDDRARRMANELDCTVVSVDYRLRRVLSIRSLRGLTIVLPPTIG